MLQASPQLLSSGANIAYQQRILNQPGRKRMHLSMLIVCLVSRSASTKAYCMPQSHGQTPEFALIRPTRHSAGELARRRATVASTACGSKSSMTSSSTGATVPIRQTAPSLLNPERLHGEGVRGVRKVHVCREDHLSASYDWPLRA